MEEDAVDNRPTDALLAELDRLRALAGDQS